MTLRLEKQDFADHAQDVAAPLARRDEVLNLIREEQEPHLVVVADRRERQHAGDLGRQFALGLLD